MGGQHSSGADIPAYRPHYGQAAAQAFSTGLLKSCSPITISKKMDVLRQPDRTRTGVPSTCRSADEAKFHDGAHARIVKGVNTLADASTKEEPAAAPATAVWTREHASLRHGAL